MVFHFILSLQKYASNMSFINNIFTVTGTNKRCKFMSEIVIKKYTLHLHLKVKIITIMTITTYCDMFQDFFQILNLTLY